LALLQDTATSTSKQSCQLATVTESWRSSIHELRKRLTSSIFTGRNTFHKIGQEIISGDKEEESKPTKRLAKLVEEMEEVTKDHGIEHSQVAESD
jgi:hypothetical protein